MAAMVFVKKVIIEERRDYNNLIYRNQHSEIRVGNADMNDANNYQQSNPLCMKQPGVGSMLTWTYECSAPLPGQYVVYYREANPNNCNLGNCVHIAELYVFIVEL